MCTECSLQHVAYRYQGIALPYLEKVWGSAADAALLLRCKVAEKNQVHSGWSSILKGTGVNDQFYGLWGILGHNFKDHCLFPVWEQIV